MRFKKLYVYIIIFIIIIVSITLFCTNKISRASANTYKILVDVEDSKLYLFKDEKIEKIYSCAGGKTSTPSPIGKWTIVSKGKWGEGFGGSWLGFNVPWGSFGIHGTTEYGSVGWSSSHRMYTYE